MNNALLVIDDNEIFNQILVELLIHHGIDAHGACTPETGLTLAQEILPQRIVLDLNLGSVSGLTLIPKLLDINPLCKIVLLTGYASIVTAVEAIKLGAIQYLTKPVSISTLLAAFESEIPNPTQPMDPTPLSVDRLTYEHIQRVLHEQKGNISSTARALKMHRRTLQRKLAKNPVQP